MTRIKTATFTIRVWTQIDPEQAFDDFLYHEKLFNLTCGDTNACEIARKITALPNVNAVEVIGENGAGRLLYPSWP